MTQALRRVRLVAALLWVAALSGCASVYVDNSVKEVPAAQFRTPEQPHAVQVLFEFQTKGVANARATDHLKTKVLEQIKSSGLFSAVSATEPVAGGATLSIVIDNVPMSDNAFSKGFVTGLTLGLAGTQVGDGYVCTASYRANGEASAIVKKVRHAIYTTLGATSGPTNATKAASIEEGVFLMTRQVVSNVLYDVSSDASFK